MMTEERDAMIDRAELSNLYHTTRIPLAGKRDSDGRLLDTPYQRKLLAARWYHEKHPEVSSTKAYLAFEAT